MPNILPSPLGGGLTKGAEGFMRSHQVMRELAQRDRQLGQTDVDLARQDQQLAFTSLMDMIPFLPRDVPISEMQGMRELFGRALPEFDINDPILGQTVLNEDTIERMGGRLMMNQLDTMGDTPERQAFIERGLNRIFTGEGVTSETLGAKESQVQLQSQLFHDNYNEMMKDPYTRRQVARAYMGLDPEVTFTWRGQNYTFDTTTGANIVGDLLKNVDMMNLRMFELDAAQQVDFAEELMKQVSTVTGEEKAIGRPAAIRIIQTFNKSAKDQPEGGWAEGEDPWVNMMTELEAAALKDPSAEGALLAARLFGRSANYARNISERMLSQTPTGRQSLGLTAVGRMVAESFPKASSGQALKFTEALLSANPNFGVEIEQKWGFGNYDVQFGTPGANVRIGGQTITPRTERPDAGPGVPPADRPGQGAGALDDAELANLIVGDIQSVMSGTMSMEDLEARWPAVFRLMMEEEVRAGGGGGTP